jgi:hypothetical protein
VTHPYRSPAGPEPVPPRVEPAPARDLPLCALILALGAIPVGEQIAHGGVWTAEPSLGLLLCLFGGHGLVAGLLDRVGARRRRHR